MVNKYLFAIEYKPTVEIANPMEIASLYNQISHILVSFK